MTDSTCRPSDSRALRRILTPRLLSRRMLPLWALFAAVAASQFVTVRMSLAMNEWNGQFYDALQKTDGEAVLSALGDFAVLATGLITVLVLVQYAKVRLLIALRRHVTFALFDRWFQPSGAHFVLRDSGAEPDNPDQRVLEDSRALVSLSVNLTLSFLESVLTLGSFSALLWRLSGDLTVGNVTIPGYMFWACLLWTVAGTLGAHWIGKPLKDLNFRVQHREADLRAAFIERRLHADAVAGARAEERETVRLRALFDDLRDVLIAAARRRRDLDFFTVGLGQVTQIAPILLGLPAMLAGRIALGGLMQLRGAFVDVARSLSWFLFAYQDLAQLAAVWARLSQLCGRMEAAAEKSESMRRAVPQPPPGTALSFDICLPLANDRTVRAALELPQGAAAVVCGPSGSGKTTLLKTLEGLRGNWSGTVRARPEKTLWIPQTPWIFAGTLLENLAWPQDPETLAESEAARRLRLAGLGHLEDRLLEKADWPRILSGGESQRVALLRALHARPDVLLLDESLSALDDQRAAQMLELLRTELPGTAVLLVTHQKTLQEAADRAVVLSPTT